MKLINKEQACDYLRGVKNKVNKMRRILRMIQASHLLNGAGSDTKKGLVDYKSKVSKVMEDKNEIAEHFNDFFNTAGSSTVTGVQTVIHNNSKIIKDYVLNTLQCE